MRAIIFGSLTMSVVALGQDQPVVIQTPGEITIHMSAPTPSAGVHTTVGAPQFIATHPIGGELVKGAAYSAEAVTETTQILADGNRIATSSSSMQYRDSLGRERLEEKLPASPGNQETSAQIVLISDPVANTNFTLYPQQRTAQKMPGLMIRRGQAGQFVPAPASAPNIGGLVISPGLILNGQPNQSTVNTEDLGSRMMEGVMAKGARTVRTIPAGQVGNQQPIQIVDENWYSPELQMAVMTSHSDPRTGETINRLKNIVRAEPDPALFQVPADYKIIDPAATVTVPAQ